MSDDAAEFERRVAEIEARSLARVIRAELKVEAVRAGMIDLDGLKLLDLDAVRLDERGAVDGGAALMRDLRTSKPWLFVVGNSSSAAVAPPAQAPAGKMACEMTHAEWQAGRAALLRRR